MKDGNIDYSLYTARELHEALAGIRRDLYPMNYANALVALGALDERAGAVPNETPPAIQDKSAASWIMPVWFPKAYRLVLYAFLFVLLTVNSLRLISGDLSALLPIAIQATTLIGLLTRNPWTWILVCIWSAIAVFSGITLWLAILVRGAITEPMFQFTLINALMFTGIFFLLFARKCIGSVSDPEA